MSEWTLIKTDPNAHPFAAKSTEELVEWADRFVLTGVEWLHDINHHITWEGNAPTPPGNSWLSLEGCNHDDCIKGRQWKEYLERGKV